MRGLIGGIVTGSLVSALGLGTLSVVGEQPAGVTPPAAPLVQAPEVSAVEPEPNDEPDAVSSPVGSVSIDEPQAPALPESEALGTEPDVPQVSAPEPAAPRADTDPLDEPSIGVVEGAMDAPETPDVAGFAADPVEPVFPNPQSLAPVVPEVESDLAVSTAPAQPTVVIEPEEVPDATEQAAADPVDQVEGPQEVMTDDMPEPETFVVDLGAGAFDPDPEPTPDNSDTMTAQTPEADPQEAAPQEPPPAQEVATSRLQLQGGQNSLLTDRDTGVTIRRPTTEAATEGSGEVVAEETAVPDASTTDALTLFAADAGEVSGPLMSIILIDDGSMSAASAALAGLPFPVTIALDPANPNAAALMAGYRADGFEIAVLAKLPEGAQPSDVEVTLESVFSTLPESIAVLDIGQGGLQTDRVVTEQAMGVLAAQGRGFATLSQGLNMAGRAAEQAGVPAAVIYRDLDGEDQDARIVRRFVNQAAFRARQESGVVLVGRVRPDTISALILWGTANRDDSVSIVPLSAVLMAQQ